MVNGAEVLQARKDQCRRGDEDGAIYGDCSTLLPMVPCRTYFSLKALAAALASCLQTTHAEEGVQKGLRGPNGMPVEVMGLLLGHLSTEEPGTIVVTDVSRSCTGVNTARGHDQRCLVGG